MTIKKTFLKSQKSHFSKGVNPCLWSKNANFFVYVDLVKIRLEIMLTDFPQEKRNLLDYEKQNFSKSQKSHVFKWDNPMLLVKKANYLDYLDLVKIRLAIMLSDFAEKKRNLFDYKQHEFLK